MVDIVVDIVGIQVLCLYFDLLKHCGFSWLFGNSLSTAAVSSTTGNPHDIRGNAG